MKNASLNGLRFGVSLAIKCAKKWEFALHHGRSVEGRWNEIFHRYKTTLTERERERADWNAPALSVSWILRIWQRTTNWNEVCATTFTTLSNTQWADAFAKLTFYHVMQRDVIIVSSSLQGEKKNCSLFLRHLRHCNLTGLSGDGVRWIFQSW